MLYDIHRRLVYGNNTTDKSNELRWKKFKIVKICVEENQAEIDQQLHWVESSITGQIDSLGGSLWRQLFDKTK